MNRDAFDNDREEEFWDNVEFKKPTDKWFYPGPLGYGISTGSVPAGSEVSINLTPDEKMIINHPLKIRTQLTRRDEKWKLIEVLDTKTTYLYKTKTYNVLTVKLSEKQGEYYLLTAEVIGEKGEVLDTLLSKIFTPLQGISAELTINRTVYGPGETIRFQVANNGPDLLSFGRPFTVEALKNGVWTGLPLGLMFAMDLIMLKPGDSFEQTLNLKDFKEQFPGGRYRIIKQVRGEGTDTPQELSAKFIVK